MKLRQRSQREDADRKDGANLVWMIDGGRALSLAPDEEATHATSASASTIVMGRVNADQPQITAVWYDDASSRSPTTKPRMKVPAASSPP